MLYDVKLTKYIIRLDKVRSKFKWLESATVYKTIRMHSLKKSWNYIKLRVMRQLLFKFFNEMSETLLK